MRRLEHIADPAVRAAALKPLHELVAARDALAPAAGDAEQVAAAATAPATVFEKVTGSVAGRRAGQNYAGLTVVYEDAVRDVDVRLGAAVTRAREAPLGLLLDVSLWFANEAGQRYLSEFLYLFEADGPGPRRRPAPFR